MAVTDIRIQSTWVRHPKRLKLRRRLGGDGIVSVEDLWHFTAANKPDGDLSGMSCEDVELAANWEGEPGELVATMLDVRLLDGEEGRLRVHDWAEHQPWAAASKHRSEIGRLNARKRWSKTPTKEAS